MILSKGTPRMSERDIDFNPDHQPSSSAEMFVTPEDGSVLCILQVRGLGVLTFRAVSDPDSTIGLLKFKGVAIYTLAEIGWSDRL